MTILYRASDSDYIDQGCSFAEAFETAKAYIGNVGFGRHGFVNEGIYRCQSTGKTLDLRGSTTADAAELLGCADPGAIGVDEWLPRTPAALDAARETGAMWALVDESFPPGTTTWVWLGSALDDEPELELVP